MFLDFGAGRGAFRAPAPPTAGPLVGHWIQPPGPLRGNAYATPVALRAVGAGEWRGVVAPLNERLRLYLVVARGSDGALSAFLRESGAEPRRADAVHGGAAGHGRAAPHRPGPRRIRGGV